MGFITYVENEARMELNTRLSTADAIDRKQNRAAMDAMGKSDAPSEVCGKRSRVDALNLASLSGEEVVKKRAR